MTVTSPLPGVPWTSEDPDDMTDQIAARNAAAAAEADLGPEFTALQAQVDGLEATLPATYMAVGEGIIDSFPIVAAGVAGVTDAGLTPVAGSWWKLDPADYDPPEGRKIQFRHRTTGISMTAGHVLQAALLGVAEVAEGIAATIGGNTTAVAMSAWIDLDAAATGYLTANVENAGGAATITSASIDVRYAVEA